MMSRVFTVTLTYRMRNWKKCSLGALEGAFFIIKKENGSNWRNYFWWQGGRKELEIGTVTLNPSVDKYLFLDNIALGRLNRVIKMEKYAGGKGINVSRALRELGLGSLVIGCAGGENGRFIFKELSRQKMKHHLVEITGETRTNHKIINSPDQTVTEINEPGPSISPGELAQIKKTIINFGRKTSYLVLSGSLPGGVPTDFYAEIIAALHPYHVQVILDADREQFRTGIAKAPFMVKPNRHEVEELFSTLLRDESDYKAAAGRILSQGVNYAVISNGSEGALFASKDQFIWGKSPVITAKSPIGCGDALIAGMIFGFREKKNFEETARFALATATATAMEEGTNFPCRSKVEAIMESLTMREI